ncbi:MAG: hypothetical protein WAT74_01065 [Flavobacteriales bacterium]
MRALAFIVFAASLAACRGPQDNDLCASSFTPYQDLVSDRARTSRNATYLDAMALYAQGDFEGAASGLVSYLSEPGSDKRAYLYLAVSQLAIGKPYEAELSIDQLKAAPVPGYKDPCEWYTVLCWLCSEQHGRALEGARRIAQGPHAFKREAQRLVERLEKR